jgi:uncharacterized protein YcnI
MSSLARHLRRIALLGAGATVLTATLGASPAWAHVTVHPTTLPAGSSDIEVTFRVPNERDNANTVGVQVFFPKNLPLLTVDVLPVTGWTSKVDTETLATPITTDDGPVTQIVTDITWTATAGGIAPGQYEDFVISAGSAPRQTGDVVFKSLQTYSSGEVVRWIQVASTQDPNPDTPAPVMRVTPAGAAEATTTVSSGAPSSTEGIAIAALAVAIVGLLGVVVLFVRGRKVGGTPEGDGTRPPTPAA